MEKTENLSFQEPVAEAVDRLANMIDAFHWGNWHGNKRVIVLETRVCVFDRITLRLHNPVRR